MKIAFEKEKLMHLLIFLVSKFDNKRILVEKCFEQKKIIRLSEKYIVLKKYNEKYSPSFIIALK